MGNPQATEGQALLLGDLDPGIAEHLFKMIPDVLPELVLALIDSLPGDFIAPAHEPVVGTKHSIVRFRFVPELFDQEVCAALRAFRLQNNAGDIRRCCD
jgi:hypothetical protein